MKKIMSAVVAAGFMLGSASMAAATDIKVKGTFDFGFGLYDGTNFTRHDNEESFDALQRFRSQIDFIASESLKGVAYFEIGDTHWGHGGGATWGNYGTNGAGRGAGGAMGADGVAVEVKNLYIDWLVPETDLQVRMGIQPFALPHAVKRADGEAGDYILDDDLAGILLSYNFNEMVGLNAGWFRPWDPYLNGEAAEPGSPWEGLERHDEIDLFVLTVPIQVQESFSLTPYGVYANVGRVDGTAELSWDLDPRVSSIGNWLSRNGQLGKGGDAWWAGAAFELTHFDPFVFAVDFTYGQYDSDAVYGRNVTYYGQDGTAYSTPLGNQTKRDGWAIIGKLGYKLDYFTPIVFGWYGSGTDNLFEDGMDGVMPYLSPDWGLTSFGWSNAHFGGREFVVGATPAGTWAVGVGLEDIRFIERLTSQLRVMYFEGTNDINDVPQAWYDAGVRRGDSFRYLGLLDKDDWGIEVNLDNVINIYENLDMFVELGYIRLDLDQAPYNFEKNAYKGYVGFTYSF